ncbi:MAG: hypothetical protein M1817_005078 [Caeruleum heppii]|nr:MAG: hypothetical protein M1817_005078 [Caeruleum heppii]
MATSVPASLKSADVTRFAFRAGQVEKVKPVIAYWCYYWMVNQIISKQLHKTDADAMDFTTTHMDKLEQIKADNATNDAILDDMAGQAYVEQFGVNTFKRAEDAMQANKVTRQTADTFQAASTFLDLLQIWGTPDPEVTAKSKYAKFHALRIAKAIKAGEDPNRTNRKPEPPPQEEEPLDPNDLEVQLLSTPPPEENKGQPSVEEVPDEQDTIEPRLAARSMLDESLHPSRSTSVPPAAPLQEVPASPPSPPEMDPSAAAFYNQATTGPEIVSPLEPEPTDDRKGSTGGGYFPDIPTSTEAPNLPDVPGDMDVDPPSFNAQIPPTAPSFHPSAPPPPSAPDATQAPPPFQPPTAQPQAPSAKPTAPRRAPINLPRWPGFPKPPVPPSMLQPSTSVAPSDRGEETLITDEEAVMRAQKHARWAISALNFEDVKTAVKELRGALEVLGAKV